MIGSTSHISIGRKEVSVHKATHLLCIPILEVQNYVSAPDALHLRCGTLQAYTIRRFEAHRTLQPNGYEKKAVLSSADRRGACGNEKELTE
jgi:hypothetical protein